MSGNQRAAVVTPRQPVHAAGEHWHDNNLVFCHAEGRPYTRNGLNYRFGRITRHAGIGRSRAH
jgi:hypothetical protein